jgi:hypothetical protein
MVHGKPACDMKCVLTASSFYFREFSTYYTVCSLYLWAILPALAGVAYIW